MNIAKLIESLPRVEQKKIWSVLDENLELVQYVASKDNRRRTAQKYIAKKYPNRNLILRFSHCKGLMTIPQ